MRRLPVIQDVPPEDRAAEARPRWQWVPIGAGFAVTLWLPLAMLLAPLGAAALAAHYVAASAGAGALVGRFGVTARPRDAALAAIVAAACLGLLSALPGGAALAPAVLAFVALAALGAPSAFLAARLAARRSAARRAP